MSIEPMYFWLGIGFALIIAEVLMGDLLLFFLGVGAVVVGGALWLGVPTDYGAPFVLYAALSALLLGGVRSRLSKLGAGSSDAAQASIDGDFIGRRVKVASGFDGASPGRGRVNYRGSTWDASSSQDHIAAGTLATIVGRDANLLLIDIQGE